MSVRAAEIKDSPFLAIPNEMKPLVALLHRSNHYALEFFNAHLESMGLNVKSYCILGAAFKNTSFSQLEIAKDLFIDRSTMVSLVDDLEARGLVGRNRHPDDRRQYRIVLTEQGEDLFQKVKELFGPIEDTYFSVLSASEKESLRSLLLKVLNAPKPVLGTLLDKK